MIAKFLFAALLLFHGLIHSLGFIKAYRIAAVGQLSRHIGKTAGSLWLLTALLFLMAFGLFVGGRQWWWPGAVALLLSQGLILSAWVDARWGTLANVIILAAVVIAWATHNYKQQYKTDVAAALHNMTDIPELLTEADIAGLPPVVQRYIRFTGSVGKPRVSNFYVVFEGGIRKYNAASWMPYVSEQYNVPDKGTRLFFMNARMMGLPVAGYHRFKEGKAFMDIRLLSLFRVQYQAGPVMDTAETVTIFNDMCCMAPATLTDKRIVWTAFDESHADAAFTNNGITIHASLYFNPDGSLANFVSDDRYAADEDGTMKRMRWSTPVKDYKEINSYRIAGFAEAIYHYPAGDFCYGTFKVKELRYSVSGGR